MSHGQDSSPTAETTSSTEKPWGSYRVIDSGGGFQVKRLELRPGSRISYQTHQRRSEHWFIVQGVGVVTVDGVERHVAAGQSVDVAIGTAHRIANVGENLLQFIEVQLGDYFGEDDIDRLDDDYGRTEGQSEDRAGGGTTPITSLSPHADDYAHDEGRSNPR